MAKAFSNTGVTTGVAADRTSMTTPFDGQEFFDTSTRLKYVYTGGVWVPVGNSFIFTTETLRDASITAPVEGLSAYITAPNVAAYTAASTYATNATGETTAIPIGIQTIYNGVVWVCVTPVAGLVSTQQSTTSTAAWADLATVGPSVTLVTGTTALIRLSVEIEAPAGTYARAAVAVSGATTIAAADRTSVRVSGNSGVIVAATVSRTMVISGLTSGTNVFTIKHIVGSGTGYFYLRELTVQGIA